MLASGGRVDAAGRATVSRGSRGVIPLIGHPGAVVSTGPASGSPCGAVLRSKSLRPTSLGVGLGAGAASPNLQHRPQVAVSDSATDSASGLSPEEEQAYQEMMAARKAERKAWKQEMRRRAKFDPMAAPKRPGMTVANAPAGANASADAGTARAGTSSSAASPAPALSRPRAPAPPGSAMQPKAPAPGTATPPPAAAAAAASLRVKLPRPGPPPPPQPQPAAPGTSATSAAARRREQAAAAAYEDDAEAGMAKRPAAAAGAAADDGDDELDLDGMAAMARKIMADGGDRDDDGPDGELHAVEEPNTSSRRPVAPPRGAAGAALVQPRRPGAPAPKRALMPIAQLQRQRAAAAAAAAAEGQQQKKTQQPPGAGSAASAAAAARSAAAGGKRAAAAPLRRPATTEPAAADEEDDLDWDALEAYEKYEQYVNEVTEEEARAARAAARRASSAAASTSSTAASAAKAAKPAKGRSSKAAAGGKAGADPEDALDSQLNQWEQLLNFFEVVEKDGKREEARRRKAEAEAAAAAAAAEEAEGGAAAKSAKGGKGAATAKAAAGAAAAAAAGSAALAAELEALGLLDEAGAEEDDEARGEVEVDWQSMERLFLGEGWDAELAELKAKVEASAQEVDAVMAAAEAEEGGAGPVEGWRDEVSTLLLGLVEISAKRYLGRSLLADTPAAKAAAAAAAANPAPPPPPPQAAGAAGAANSMGAAAAAAASASPLPEEERPVAFWEAPFMLLVQDDSEDPQLEYANRTALQALGWAAFDDATAGVSAAGLADASHPASQAEWLWACTDAAERPEQFSTIPSLRLRGPGPGAPAVLASGVTVFRVDSLEGEPIGQAVLVESWRRLSEQEAAAAADQ